MIKRSLNLKNLKAAIRFVLRVYCKPPYVALVAYISCNLSGARKMPGFLCLKPTTNIQINQINWINMPLKCPVPRCGGLLAVLWAEPHVIVGPKLFYVALGVF